MVEVITTSLSRLRSEHPIQPIEIRLKRERMRIEDRAGTGD